MSSNQSQAPGAQNNAPSVLAQLHNLSTQELNALAALLGLHDDAHTIDEIEAALTLLALRNSGPTIAAPPSVAAPPTARPSTPTPAAATAAGPGTMGVSPTSTITASPASNPSPKISLAEYRAWKESGIKSYPEYVASKRG